MTYQEVHDRLGKVESLMSQLSSPGFASTPDFNVQEAAEQLKMVRESLKGKLALLAEEEEGKISTDDERKAKKLADQGHNVELTNEMEDDDFGSKKVTISVRDAKRAQAAMADLGYKSEKHFEYQGSNEYIFFNSSDAYDAALSLDTQGIEVENMEEFHDMDESKFISEVVKTTLNEMSVARLQKGLAAITKHMKELAKLYKAGDKSVVEQLKELTARKKYLEAELEKAVAGTGVGQELEDI